MERDIILIGGMPGSGKSRLGKSLAHELRTEMSIEHLSIGDIVRAIGRGAINSYHSEHINKHLTGPKANELIDNRIMYDVINETLSAHDSTSHLLLDGYPRTLDQLDDLTELTAHDGRTQLGALVTITDEDLAVMRMIKRSPRDYEGNLTVTEARERIRQYVDSYTPVIRELRASGQPLKTIDTSGIKEDTNLAGLDALRTILQKTLSPDKL